MRHIHVEIHASDLLSARNELDAEQAIYLKLAEKGIPMDAPAFLRRDLRAVRGKLNWTYYAVEGKWVFDWIDEAQQ